MLPDLGRLRISQIRDVGVHHQADPPSDPRPDPKRQRLSTEPMQHGKALPNKPEWLRWRPAVDQPDIHIDTVSEYHAVEDWRREFRCDVQLLASQLTTGTPELSMSANTWTPEERKDILTLERARENKNWIPPDGKPLRECAIRAIERLPLGLTPFQFYELVYNLHMQSTNGIEFVISAMPIEPVQGQYSLIDDQKSGVVLFISNTGTRFTDDKEVKDPLLRTLEGLPLYKATVFKSGFEDSQLYKAMVFDKEVCRAVKEIEGGVQRGPIRGGTSNTGSKLEDGDVTKLNESGMFDKIANALLQEGEKDVISQMAYRTGIWKRVEKDSNEVPEEERLRDDIYEMYYTLRSALAGVSMPVYATTFNKDGRLVVLMENGMSDLKDYLKTVDGHIDRICSNYADANPVKENIGKFLERRLASASLATGEIGLLLTDSKPGNFLFQKCYYQIDVPYKENTALDLGILPVCVMATDIDPIHSYWFEHREGVFLQPYVPPAYPLVTTSQLPLIDPQCVRYCNMAAFAMAAMCVGIKSSWGIHVYNHCLIQAVRYKNAVNEENKGHMHKLCLELHYMKLLDVLNKEKDNDKQLEEWSYQMYDSAKVNNSKFPNFVKGLAKQITDQMIHYGMLHSKPYLCTGPLKVAKASESGNDILGEVVAWMIERASEEARRLKNEAIQSDRL